jgi:hypothetical protein
MMKLFRLALSLMFLGGLLSGCTEFAIPINPDETLEPSNGYLYGRFSISSGALTPLQMGFAVSTLDMKHQKIIRFEREDDTYAVALKPGSYKMTSIVFTKTYQKEGEEALPSSLADHVILVEPGKAYYIGDYVGDAEMMFAVLFTANNWRLKEVKNNYTATTERLEALYPQFKVLPKIDVYGVSLNEAFSTQAQHDTLTPPVINTPK